MITLMASFKAYSEKNIEGLNSLLESVEKYIPIDFELLIKLDLDDKKGIDYIKSINKSYIKPFTFHRWEGRWTINFFYDYLFIHRNLSSKHIVLVTDDIVITRNFLDDLDDIHLIFGDYQTEMTKEKLNKVEDYSGMHWLTSEYICSYPIVSTKLIEITGNFGYQPNPDSHLALLNVIMFQKYNKIITKHIPEFIIRDNIDRIDNYGESFNRENLVTDSDMLSNKYIFELIKQQAKNIHLNTLENV